MLIAFSALLNLASLKWITEPSGVRDFADALVSRRRMPHSLRSFTVIFREHWRSIVWIGCAMVVVTDGVIAAMHGEIDMFLVSTMLMMMGTGAIFPWSVRWQGSFNILCVVAWSAMRLGAGHHDSNEAEQWLGVLMASAMSQAVTVMRERSTREREQAERKTRDSEEKLRKVFEVSSDVITISAAGDGHYIDVNPAFEISGYTRAEAIATSAPRFSVWPNASDRKRFFDELTSLGQVKNLEIGFRARNGTIIPCLVSAAKSVVQGESALSPSAAISPI